MSLFPSSKSKLQSPKITDFGFEQDKTNDKLFVILGKNKYVIRDDIFDNLTSIPNKDNYHIEREGGNYYLVSKKGALDITSHSSWLELVETLSGTSLGSLQLSKNISEEANEPKTLEELPICCNDTLAGKGHTLDMKVNGKLIYNHLEVFKNHLIKNHTNNTVLAQALSGFYKKIRALKLYAPSVIKKEQKKDIRDRTIVLGNEKGNNRLSATIGVPNLTYLRHNKFTQNVPQVEQYITEVQACGLDEADAVRLFVLIAGLPKAGYMTPGGEWYEVGDSADFAYSTAVWGGKVKLLSFGNGEAKLSVAYVSNVEEKLSVAYADLARPSFSKSNLG